MRIWLLAVAGLLLGAAPASLLPNGGFEDGMAGWGALWTRDPGVGTAALVTTGPHGGARCLCVTHRGAQDWAVNRVETLSVAPGQIYAMRAWARVQGTGTVTMCVTLRDGAGEVINWMYAARSLGAGDGWRELSARFVIPPGAATMQPRMVGVGPAIVYVDDVSLTLEGKVQVMPPEEMATRPSVENSALTLELHPQDAAFAVIDRRTGRAWAQTATPGGPMLTSYQAAEGGFDLELVLPESASTFHAAVRLDGDRPELTVELHGDGPMPHPLRWPNPFATRRGDLLIMPVNEGISYPAADDSLPEMGYILYGGHGLCMAWYGVSAGTDGMMAIVETPDDASVGVRRADGLLAEAPQWDPQMGRFGYARRMRYVFLADGGYVAMAKRYRAYAQQAGLFKTLAQKRQSVPAVDMLVGAVNVWCWDPDAPAICSRMQSQGVDRILWSNRRSPQEVDALNAMGVLTQPLRHLPGRDGPGQLPEGGLPAPGLDDGRISAGLHRRRGRQADQRLDGGGQGR